MPIDNSGQTDLIGQTIAALSQQILFIVAAGNDLRPSDGNDCGENYPACYRNLPNVLTVVGLDRKETPNLWRVASNTGSNWSKEFGIAAIAENVLSTTFKDRIGVMSGTSQAAPQVTAAASLIYSMFETHFSTTKPALLPIEVKNRLIYSSEIFNELLPKVEGGRLNVERALDMANDYFEAEIDGEIRKLAGTVIDFGPGFIRCKRGSQPLEIAASDLRRMYYDDIQNRYVLFYNSQHNDRSSSLVRETNCNLETRSQVVTLKIDHPSEVVAFRIDSIKDFVSAMFE